MDTSLLKRVNTTKIRTALRASNMGSKNSLASVTGLSVGTCSNILKELIATGEVLEIEHAESTGGRRSRQFKYNKNFAYVMSMYLRKENQETSIYYQVTNLYGEIIEKDFISVDYMNVLEINQVIDHVVNKYEQLSAMSIGVPGVVQDGALDICDIDALVGFPLKKHLEDRYKMLVAVENDVNASAIGYYNKLNLEDESLVYIYYPLNGYPGSGIVIRGEVLRGFSNFSGEISFLPMKDRKDNLEACTEKVIHTIQSFTCIINPKHLVLSGLGFSETELEIIESTLHNRLSSKHLPNIEYEADFHDSYIFGLQSMALELYYKSK